jgi:hypothetical protein
MSARSIAVISLVSVSLAAFGAAKTYSWLRSASFTENAQIDRGTYFRLKVDYSYRGKPQHFNIVVGCNVLSIRYKDGSGTYEPGLTPTVYGQRMTDGKAVVVRPPDACRGSTTENGEVPQNFLPVMVVYNDADTMGFGTAYMSDEAYDSPYSLMTFGKATIERATREEFIDFRENGPPNAVTRSQYHSVQWNDTLERLGLQRSHPAFGWHCHGYSRWKLNEEQQAIVRKRWPPNRPNYWTLADRKQLSDLTGEIVTSSQTPVGTKMMRDDGRMIASGAGMDWYEDFGAMRRDGVSRVGFSIAHVANAISLYPADMTMSQDKWPELPDERAAAYAALKAITTAAIEVDGGKKRGFAYCFAMDWPRQYKRLVESVPAGAMVDGETVQGTIDRWKGFGTDVPMIVERDQYILRYQQYFLESIRGDV